MTTITVHYAFGSVTDLDVDVRAATLVGDTPVGGFPADLTGRGLTYAEAAEMFGRAVAHAGDAAHRVTLEAHP